MKISKDANRASRKLFRACLESNGRLNAERVRNVVRAVAQGKPRGYLAILTAFERLVRLDVSKRHAVIESASEISPALAEQVRGDLQKKYGDDLDFEYVVNPQLIGGLRVRVGSHVWDGSVRAKLESLRSKLA
jgi:F-type H+-transporting ATPase subunit delta